MRGHTPVMTVSPAAASAAKFAALVPLEPRTPNLGPHAEDRAKASEDLVGAAR